MSKLRALTESQSIEEAMLGTGCVGPVVRVLIEYSY